MMINFRFSSLLMPVTPLLLTMALTLTLFGCADPNYIDPEDLNQPPQPHQQPSCQAVFEASRLCILITWETMPTEESFGSFVLSVLREDESGTLTLHDPIAQDSPDKLAVVLWMPSMGHGSSPVRVERLSEGTYRATDVFFTMPGDWDIQVQIKAGKNTKDQALVPIRI